MLFGDPAQFAVEADFTGREGEWRFGRFRLLVHGAEYGDFGDTVDLASSCQWGRTFLEHSKERTRSDLDQRSASAVYDELVGRFMNGRGDGDPFDRDTFLFDDIGDSSLRDKTTVLVVRRADGHDRVILRDLSSEQVQEVIVPPWTCDRVVRAFCDWIDALVGSPGPST
ncbi:MAG: Imm42 family immunity protein [Myxococcales bacterium]|nr:Imm42 family immunity protein [Myxococcales bacterium]